MKVGAEPRKVAVLVLLMIAAGYLFYRQWFMEPGAAPAPRPQPASPARQVRSAADDILETRSSGSRTSQRRTSYEFKPTLKRSKPGEGPDPIKLDPTLRVDLLARVQAVKFEGVERNLFQFGAAKPKPAPKQAELAKAAADGPASPKPEVKPDNSPPPKPPPPPVSFKYYGYVNRPGDARKRAFLLDGEEIFVAVEGEVIKKRYRIVRIGVNSLVVEDMDHKSQQTLPLQESG